MFYRAKGQTEHCYMRWSDPHRISYIHHHLHLTLPLCHEAPLLDRVGSLVFYNN